MSKVHYVYELVNQSGEIEYIGKTCNPDYRLKQHTKKKPGKGCGLFYGRTDLTMKLVKGYPTHKEALKAETQHKILHNHELTERNAGIKCGNIAKESGQIYELAKSNIENGTLELARRNSREVNRREVLAYEYPSMKFIKKFDALTDVKNELPVQTGHVCSVCKGDLKQHKGYTFRYA